MRPSSADTSEPAWTKRKMLSMKSSTSCPWSRKYSHRQAGEADAQAGPRRLVHLAVAEGDLVDHVAAVACRRLAHLDQQVVAFAGAFAHPGEDRDAAVLAGEVRDQLLDQHRLADAGAAEEPDLAAADVGGDQVDDLDPGLEDLDL